MRMSYHHIMLVIAMFLCSTGAFAQVHIGNGVTINKGTSITIQGQDVIFDTDEIKGEGKIIIQNEKSQKITVNKDFKSNDQIEIKSNHLEVNGRYAQKFAAHHLPPISDEIIAAKQKEEAKQELPVRYINTEGLTFGFENNEEKKEPSISALPKDVSGGIIISEVMQMQTADLNEDYIIPIYSVILNVERFSDDAELYEFECSTAILKPPIV